jgi:hypothetical protein
VYNDARLADQNENTAWNISDRTDAGFSRRNFDQSRLIRTILNTEAKLWHEQVVTIAADPARRRGEDGTDAAVAVAEGIPQGAGGSGTTLAAVVEGHAG